MNIKEWAEKLNNIEYPADEIWDMRKELENDGVVVVYGASDDLIEIEGAIIDEYPAYVEETYYWSGNGFISNDRINEFLDYIDDEYREFYPLFRNNKEQSWIRTKPGKDCQFEYETNIPCEWFNVMEDGELYCKGFVFNRSDLKEK